MLDYLGHEFFCIRSFILFLYASMFLFFRVLLMNYEFCFICKYIAPDRALVVLKLFPLPFMQNLTISFFLLRDNFWSLNSFFVVCLHFHSSVYDWRVILISIVFNPLDWLINRFAISLVEIPCAFVISQR